MNPVLAATECVDGNVAVTGSSPTLIITTGIIGIVFSVWLLQTVAAVKLDVGPQTGKLIELYTDIKTGANSFLFAEYQLCVIFVAVFAPAMSVLIAWAQREDEAEWAWTTGVLAGVSFVVGALTSIVSGYIGMLVAVYSNARCTVGATKGGAPGRAASRMHA